MSLLSYPFQPPVIAHRGARGSAPENTLAAYKRAKEEGAVWVETDVKLTHDGVPILMHDDELDRTTNGKGLVADMPWSEFQKLDAGGWFDPQFSGERVPALSEFLAFVFAQNLRVNLELKPCPGRTQATAMVTLIEAAKVWPHSAPPPLISSFDVEALVIASGLHPEWPRGLLLEEWSEDWGDLVRRTKADAIHVDEEILTKGRVDAFLQARLPVLAFTVNDPARMKELLHWGVTAVFTDHPGQLIKAL
jgi:glycerophosphoryl diester phosphodiesterase